MKIENFDKKTDDLPFFVPLAFPAALDFLVDFLMVLLVTLDLAVTILLMSNNELFTFDFLLVDFDLDFDFPDFLVELEPIISFKEIAFLLLLLEFLLPAERLFKPDEVIFPLFGVLTVFFEVDL